MNIAAFCNTGLTATYRTIAEDFHAAEFNLMRNVTGLLASSIWCACYGYSPLRQFPKDKKCALLWRCLTGQANFVLLSLAAPLAPLALIMVFWQTNPFWISLIACCLLGERIVPLELVSIFLCFAAVIVIATQ